MSRYDWHKTLLEGLLHLHAARDAFEAGGHKKCRNEVEAVIGRLESWVMSGQGYGPREWSDEQRAKRSQQMKDRWANRRAGAA